MAPVAPWIHRTSPPSGGGGRVICQLWEGQCITTNGADYTPFEFLGTEQPPPSVTRYDPLGIINPSTVAFNGSGSFGGGGPVPAGSSIIIPQTGLYRHSFSGHCALQDAVTGDIDFSAHMGTDETVVDIIDGYIGWNWSQSAQNPDDGQGLVAFPDPLTWIGLVSHSAGAAVYWAGQSNSPDATINQFGFTWVIEIIEAADGSGS